nr:cellulase family glycosylhydrolase [uncultured Carboxylicivirga sp.]
MQKYLSKSILLVLLLVIVMPLQAQEGFTSDDFLNADGPVIKNQLGEVVPLRGTNLGSWLSMEYWIGPLGYGMIDRTDWSCSFSETLSKDNMNYIFDGDDATCWNSGVPQSSSEGQYVIIDCGKGVVFDKISFISQNADEAPVSYTVSVSGNGSAWTEVSWGNGTSKYVDVYIGAIEAQYVRIAQNGDSEFNWSIAEFNLYMNDDFTVRNATYNRFGVTKADELWDYYQDLWITTTDLDSIKAMGMNMVRVPFYWMEIMNNDGTIKTDAFKQLDWVVAECSQRQIYVVLDLHGAPGGLDGYITSGQAVTNDLWYDEESQQRTINLWKAVAEHFVGEPAVAAYDLMNEPVSTNSSFTISDMYDIIYKAVREVDTDHMISVQAFYNFSMIDDPSTRGWENMLYQAHYYNTDFYNWDSQNGFINYALGDMAWHQQHWNIPVLAGEYNFWGFLDLWAKWMNGINGFNGSWSNWTYKNMTSDKNWGLYLGNSNVVPDLNLDSEEMIKEKWDKFTTNKFYRNADLIDTVSSYTQSNTYKAIGKIIYLKAYNSTYISSENGVSAMTCSTTKLTDLECFTVEDAGEGKIALKGNNGKYVSSNNGISSMTCDKDEIGESEKFYWVDLANNQLALLGVGGFVSMEGGSIPITANRTNIDGWEVFNWAERSTGIEDEMLADNFKLYPNPLRTDKILNYSMTDNRRYQLSVYNTGGAKVYSEDISGGGQINLAELNPGIYLIKVGQRKEKLVIY